MTRKALGKGLSALLGDAQPPEERLVELDIDLIDPNNHQPRTRFKQQKLQELAASIKANGVVQPIVVRRRGLRYQLIAGERRWRAAQLAGISKIPAVVRDAADDQLLELSLIENIQREDLNPIEEAQAYHRLIEELKLTQEQVAQRVGRDRSSVTNYLRLLKLPREIQKLVEDEKLSMGHARALLALPSAQLQKEVASEITSRGLSVRDTEKMIQRLLTSGARKKSSAAPTTDPHVRAAEDQLCRWLATKVRIIPNGRGGRIEIEYYSDSDLERIFNIIMRKERQTNEIPQS
jgi:ParB family chromosome partitioning protein